MSSSVSQIEYWREPNKPGKKNDANNANNANNATAGGPGAIYLSYDIFMALTILGGALALDHLYLRSPLTFLAKLIVNVLTFGTWWLYDASQAVFNKDVVKVFGLGVPGMGPKGIAAGVLGSDIPDKKHMAFFIYALALMFGGLFGLDSFIVGDKQTGLIRLVCLITVILAPIALFWWLFNLGKFFFKTKDVTNLYWEYFGAQEPAEHGMTLGEKLVTRFPFLQKIFGPISRVKNAVVGTAEGVVSTAEAVAYAAFEDPLGTAKRVIIAPAMIAKEKVGEAVTFAEGKLDEAVDLAGDVVLAPVTKATEKVENIAGKFSEQLKPAVNAALVPVTGAISTAIAPVIAAVDPLKQTLNTGLATAQTGLEVAQQGLALGKTAINTGRTVADKTLNVVGQTAQAATKALTLAPAAMAMANGLTPASAQAALSTLQKGGGASDSNVLPYVLMGTLAIIAVSGLILTYRRSRQNVKPRKDDHPPNPETPISRVL
jgi:hypothetical protein